MSPPQTQSGVPAGQTQDLPALEYRTATDAENADDRPSQPILFGGTLYVTCLIHFPFFLGAARSNSVGVVEASTGFLLWQFMYSVASTIVLSCALKLWRLIHRNALVDRKPAAAIRTGIANAVFAGVLLLVKHHLKWPSDDILLIGMLFVLPLIAPVWLGRRRLQTTTGTGP